MTLYEKKVIRVKDGDEARFQNVDIWRINVWFLNL